MIWPLFTDGDAGYNSKTEGTYNLQVTLMK
jgi:hypothetical protein